jgi:hypothetical protein
LTFHGYHESLGFLLLMTLVRETVRADGEIAAADRDVEVISGFSEVTKALIDRAVVRGLSDKGAILKVLAILEARVKESFRREKTINPALLMQPFAEVGQMLAGASYSTLPDREEIIAELRRILNQFAALEGVTSRLEVSVEGTDTASSFHEDLPFTAPRPPEDA